MDQLELLKRQYLQLLDPELLSLPPADVIRLPHVQAQIHETMFRDGCLPYPPPDRYRLRVLKVLVQRMEAAIADPEEDVGSLTLPCFFVKRRMCFPSTASVSSAYWWTHLVSGRRSPMILQLVYPTSCLNRRFPQL